MALPTSGWLPTPQLNPIDSGPLPLPHTAYYFDPNNPPLEVVEDAPGVVTFVEVGQGDFDATGRAGRNAEREPVMVAKLQFNDVYGILLVDQFDVPESPGLLRGQTEDELDFGLDVDPSRLDDYFREIAPEELDLGLEIQGIRLERAGCTMAFVLEQGQMESGIDARGVTTLQALSQHVLRFRQRLLSRCASEWLDVENGDLEIDVPDVIGWGGPWGGPWGGDANLDPAVTIAEMEAIWEAKARRVSDGEWVKAKVLSPTDDDLGDPAILLRDTEVVLLRFTEEWQGIYDRVRLVGIRVPAMTGIVWDETILPPNELIGPVFCRCLVLEAARFLALKGDLAVEAGSLGRELRSAQSDLLAQVRSHNDTRTTRE
jgi:hypothetical protein